MRTFFLLFILSLFNNSLYSKVIICDKETGDCDEITRVKLPGKDWVDACCSHFDIDPNLKTCEDDCADKENINKNDSINEFLLPVPVPSNNPKNDSIKKIIPEENEERAYLLKIMESNNIAEVEIVLDDGKLLQVTLDSNKNNYYSRASLSLLTGGLIILLWLLKKQQSKVNAS